MRKCISLFFIFYCVCTLFSSPRDLSELYQNGHIRIVEEMIIDQSSLPEDVLLETPVNITWGQDDCIYVCDFKANNIKKLEESGRYLKTIGNKGQGPGEFYRPSGIAVSKNRIVVWDMRNSRLCSLSLDGKFIKSIHIMPSEGIPRKFRVLPNGDFVIALEKIYYKDFEKPQDFILAVYSPDLIKKVTIYSHPIWRNKYTRIGGVFTNIIQPYSPDVHWDINAEGNIVVGYSEDYLIEIYSPKGEKLDSFSHYYNPVKVTKKDKNAFFSSIRSNINRKEFNKEVIKRTKFPKFKPFFNEIRTDSEGNILVFIYRDDPKEKMKHFHAFNSNGNFLGEVKVLEGIFPSYGTKIRGNIFWSLKIDKKGYYTIVKNKITN